MDGGCGRPILRETPSQLQFFVSCKIAAITAFLQQTVIAKITNRLTIAAGFLASNFLTVDPEPPVILQAGLDGAGL